MSDDKEAEEDSGEIHESDDENDGYACGVDDQDFRLLMLQMWEVKDMVCFFREAFTGMYLGVVGDWAQGVLGPRRYLEEGHTLTHFL